MIQKIVLIAAMGTMGLLWGSSDVTIQVINAVKEQSITPEFDKKLAKAGLSIHKVVEGGRYIVTLGTFKDEKSATTALKKARKIVDAGAFVRLVNREHAAAPHEATKSVHAVAAAHETSVAKEVAVIATPKEEHVVLVEVKPVVVEVTNAPAATVVASSSSEKKEAHRNEIAEAIHFYKNSPYHRFEPVMLQQ
ncbi:MAG: SPOR domain-containing protein [Sulfuricurvum sp.]